MLYIFSLEVTRQASADVINGEIASQNIITEPALPEAGFLNSADSAPKTSAIEKEDRMEVKDDKEKGPEEGNVAKEASNPAIITNPDSGLSSPNEVALNFPDFAKNLISPRNMEPNQTVGIGSIRAYKISGDVPIGSPYSPKSFSPGMTKFLYWIATASALYGLFLSTLPVADRKKSVVNW